MEYNNKVKTKQFVLERRPAAEMLNGILGEPASMKLSRRSNSSLVNIKQNFQICIWVFEIVILKHQQRVFGLRAHFSSAEPGLMR